MIDTLDLIIYGVKRLDFKYLKNLGIIIKPYKDKKIYDYQINNLTIQEFNEIIRDTIRDVGYTFNYKNINFKYNVRHKYLLLTTKVSKIIEKDIITLSDKTRYKEKVEECIREVLKVPYQIYIARIDYMVDIKMESDEKVQEYIKLLNKHNNRYFYMKKKKNYDGEDYKTSIYLTNKTGQLTLNFYNKYREQITKDNYKNNYKGVLRLEVQNKPARIKAQKYKENGRDSTLNSYYSKESMIDNYFNVIRPYLYLGDYYKLRGAKKIINASEKSKKWKKKLKEFLNAVAKYGTVKGVYENKFCCEDTGKKYVSILEQLGINPVTIDETSKYDYLPNLYKMALEVAEKKYFR